MIRRWLVSIVGGFLVSAFFVQWSWSQTDSGSLRKIGFVDNLRVLYETREGKSEISKIQGFINDKQKEYDSQMLALDRLRQQFESESRNFDRITGLTRQREIEDKGRQLQRLQEDIQAEIVLRRDKALSNISVKIGEILTEYGKDKSFGVIFVKGETQIYVDPTLDITSQIIRIYNQKHGGPLVSSSPPSTTP